jgi:hypothetical protein
LAVILSGVERQPKKAAVSISNAPCNDAFIMETLF